MTALMLVRLLPLTSAPCAAEEPVPPQDTQQIKINAKVRQVANLIDRKVYKVSDDLQSVTGSAVDVLNNIPSVTVDADGNVSLRGEGNVTILIDGKPSAQLTGSKSGDGLLQFGASDIDKIEVMTSAPAEFRAEGSGGVINIITKKNRKLGSSGSFLANAGNQQRYVLGASVASNTEHLKLSGGFGLRQDDRLRIILTKLDEFAAGADQSSQDKLVEHARRLIPSIKGNVEYEFDATRSLGFDINMRERSGDRYFDESSSSSLASSTRHSDGHEWSMSGEQRVNYLQKFDGNDETLNVSLHRTTDVERERYAYLQTSLQPLPGQSVDHLYLAHDFATVDASIDYRKVLSQERVLKLGYNYQHDDNGYGNAGDKLDPFSGQIDPNPDLTNQFRYRQAISALYASYDQTLGQWAASIGVRAEHTNAVGNQITTGIQNQRSYGGLYPSLHLERTLDETSGLSFGLSRRLSRPDPEQLNPFIDHQDIHNLRAGNPYLLPQDTWSIEGAYRVETDQRAYGVSAYLRHTRDSVTDVALVQSPGVLLTTKENLPQSKASGLEFNASGPLTPTLSYRLSGNLFRAEIDASALGATGLQTTSGLNVKGSLDYRPSKNVTAQLSLNRVDKRLTPQGYIGPINLVNLGYKHQLQPDLALVMTLSDAFNGQRFKRQLNTPSFAQTYQREQVGRIAYIGLTYQFGVASKAKSGAFEYDQ